jgi:Sugar (and other) transporter
LTPVYFWFISNEWKYLAYTAFIFALVGFILTLIIIPDTPRFYYSKGRYDDARKALGVFYKYNIGSKNSTTNSIVSSEGADKNAINNNYPYIIFDKELNEVL